METEGLQQRKALRNSINKYVAADALKASAHLRKDTNRIKVARNFTERNKQRKKSMVAH